MSRRRTHGSEASSGSANPIRKPAFPAVLYRDLIDSMPDIVYSAAPDGTLLFVGPQVQRYGYTEEELVSRPFIDIVYPEDRDALLRDFQHTVETGEQLLSTFRVPTKNGRIAWFESTGRIVRDAAGDIVSVSGMLRDITDQKQKEKERFEALSRFAGFADASQYGMGMADLDGHIVYVNQALADMLGETSPDDCDGKHFPGTYYPEAMKRKLQEEVMPALMSEGQWHGELELLTRDGRHVPTDENYFVIRDEDGAPRYLADILTDITDRKRAEETLRRSETQLSDALRMARAGHWEYDIESDTFTFNDNFYLMFGTTAEDVGGYTMSSAEYARRFCHPDDIHMVLDEVRSAILADDPFYSRHLEHRILRADGSVGYIVVRFFVSKDSQGRTYKTYGVNQDITERVHDEEERARLKTQVQQAQKMEAVGRLAGGVAHDFNNLLTVIMNYVDLCYGEVDEGHPIRPWLDEILAESQRSANIVRQLLAFARKEAIVPKVVDLNEVVSGMLRLLRHLIGEDIELVWMPGADIWPVKMDPGHVDQLLANLCVNARDVIEGAGRVTVETRNVSLDARHEPMYVPALPGDYVLLSVSDTGCGMTEEALMHIFEPFYTTKDVGKGTGLGLATVHGIVKQCGGGLNVSSALGAGSTFRIYLPRTTPVGGEPEPDNGRGKKSPRGDETVLLVEDKNSLRVTCQLFLEELGYTVLSAEEPERACRLSDDYSGPIHILVTDMVMPGMTGHELAKRLASSRPAMKRLYISGYTADMAEDRITLGENEAFLAKPFSRDDLSREVRRLLDA